MTYKQIIALNQQLKEQKKILKAYASLHERIMSLNKQVFLDDDLKNKNIKYGIKPWIVGYGLPQSLDLSKLKIVSRTDKEFFTELLFEFSTTISNKKYIKEFLYQVASLKSHITIKKIKYYFLQANNMASKSQNKIYILFSILTKKNFFPFKHSNLNFDEKKINICRDYLIRYSIDQLCMVGFLAENPIGKKWGLIRLPNENICKVELGSEVGIEKVSVAFIDAKKIIFQSKDKKKKFELIIKNKDLF